MIMEKIMTTVSQLIEYLQTLPQNAEVLVLTEHFNRTTFDPIELPTSTHVSVENFNDTVFVEFGKVIK